MADSAQRAAARALSASASFSTRAVFFSSAGPDRVVPLFEDLHVGIGGDGQHGGAGHAGHSGDSRMAARDAPESTDRADPPGAHRLPVEEPGQVIGQGRGGRVTIDGTLGQGLQDDGLKIPRDPPVDHPGRRGFAAADLIQQLGRGVAVERRPERQQLVQRGPQAVDVGPPVDDPRARLLGTHVPRRAQQAVVMGQAGIGEPAGQAEVRHPDRSLLVDQQVGGLDVAMDHAMMVGVRERLGRLEADFRNPAKIGRSARGIEGGRRGLVITGAGQRGPGAGHVLRPWPGLPRAAAPSPLF